MNLFRSVYRFAITEEMLLSLSMAHQNQAFTSQQQLCDHFVQNKILHPDLSQHFLKLDRKHFQGDQDLPLNQLYGNYPIRLNKFDNMTTPIMHAIPSNYIYEDAATKDKVKILDVGTGRGYIAFLLKHALPNAIVHGIDINQRLIDQCQNLKQQLSTNDIEFKQSNIYDLRDDNYDYINIGFALRENDLQQFVNICNQFIICPLISAQEQWLTKINKNGAQTKLMKCMYQIGLKQQRQGASSLEFLKEKEEQLENFIKSWHSDFQQKHKRKPLLQEMQSDQELSQCLIDLKKTKIEIKRV